MKEPIDKGTLDVWIRGWRMDDRTYERFRDELMDECTHG